VAPRGRGWRKLIPIATAAAALSLAAEVATAQDGGVTAGDGGTPTTDPSEPAAGGGDFVLHSAEASPRKSFFDGVLPPTVTYVFSGSGATDIRIDVVNKDTRALVDTIVDPAAEPHVENTAIWDGIGADGARAANGRYAFRIGAATAAARATPDAGFGFYSHRFPLSARHGYGDGYGAGRDHQGQDVFARCGKKVVAARGGRVQVNKSHSAAGNYVVIDGKGTGTDYMYAHLESRSPLRRGTRVRTGQEIGRVGASGNASDCHLHFEVWSAPGWYEGGEPLPSVRRLLKTWDAWS
jgi:murein DD-endopeptidase MepM/ murein hydrolase activator NlpD